MFLGHGKDTLSILTLMGVIENIFIDRLVSYQSLKHFAVHYENVLSGADSASS
jgi:hypothetical protein